MVSSHEESRDWKIGVFHAEGVGRGSWSPSGSIRNISNAEGQGRIRIGVESLKPRASPNPFAAATSKKKKRRGRVTLPRRCFFDVVPGFLKLVAQRELHHARVSQQPRVVTE